MAARTTRSFNELDRQALLKELENWRAKCILVCTKAPIKSEVYNLADKLISDIDIAVEKLTGDRKYFHTKHHSTN